LQKSHIIQIELQKQKKYSHLDYLTKSKKDKEHFKGNNGITLLHSGFSSFIVSWKRFNQSTYTYIQNWILDSPITASLSREISFPKNQGNKKKVK
jgi:hypothetical protein